MAKKRLYFGHPVNVYGTELQKFLLDRIRRGFREWEIVNPDRPEHDGGYARYKRETGNGMEYYKKEVLPRCHGGVFLPFSDGMWGAGVHLEASTFVERRRRIWIIASHGQIRRARSWNEIRVLSVEETRARIRDANGMLPY
jgi:hypothetical protein